jgi:hypothetical protein
MRQRVTALIPAHNEADRIGAALASLHAQTEPPARIIVVADNCTDATADLARAGGAEVFETTGNRHKKAGARNEVLALLLPQLGQHDVAPDHVSAQHDGRSVGAAQQTSTAPVGGGASYRARV